MTREIGTRVLAIRNGDPKTKTLYVFGAGIYAGDFPRPGTIEPQVGDEQYEMLRKVIDDPRSLEFIAALEKQLDDDLAAGTITQEKYDATKKRGAELDARPIEQKVRDLWESTSKNPRIDLDNGKTVWGMECWWGPEDAVRARYPESEWTYVEVAP